MIVPTFFLARSSSGEEEEFEDDSPFPNLRLADSKLLPPPPFNL